MKHTKGMLALLLALAMTLSLALPAMAEDETTAITEIAAEIQTEAAEEAETAAEVTPQAEVQLQQNVGWEEFYIITQPERQSVENGDGFTLSVEVNIPEGAEVEYRWYNYSDSILVGSERELTLTPDDEGYPAAGSDVQAMFERILIPTSSVEREYYCVILCSATVEEQLVEQRLYSNTVIVKVDIGSRPWYYAIPGTLIWALQLLLLPLAAIVIPLVAAPFTGGATLLLWPFAAIGTFLGGGVLEIAMIFVNMFNIDVFGVAETYLAQIFEWLAELTGG